MKTERELFTQWVKKEHPHIFNGAEQGNDRFRMDIDFMFMSWQASSNREGYKLLPITPTDEMIVAIENKVQEQLDASAITADMFRLDGERIFESLINAI